MGSLVEIARFYDPEEAYCAQGYLRSYGIDTIIQNEHHLAMNPSLRVALGGYGLLGFADVKEEARAALEEIPLEAADSVITTDMELISPRKWYLAPVAVISGVPFLPRGKSALGLLILALPGALLWSAYLANVMSRAGWLH